MAQTTTQPEVLQAATLELTKPDGSPTVSVPIQPYLCHPLTWEDVVEYVEQEAELNRELGYGQVIRVERRNADTQYYVPTRSYGLVELVRRDLGHSLAH